MIREGWTDGIEIPLLSSTGVWDRQAFLLRHDLEEGKARADGFT